MTLLIDINAAQETRYETPTFSPSGAFATTLRGAEKARLARQEQRYETPTFDPRGAFARTLRSGEIARRERRLHSSDSLELSVLAGAC